ncbi:MAG: ArdC family protein, partial [Dehalococcoidales bacterium]|nr:ArdC family protein [Dehalococcoidales bacterium]
KSLLQDSLESEKETLKLLPQTTGRKGKSELEELVIALRDAPTVEEQTWIKLSAPRKVMEQYRKLSYPQIREIEQRYPPELGSASYRANHLAALPAGNTQGSPDSGLLPPESWLSRLLKAGAAMAIPTGWSRLLADNNPLKELDLLPTTEAAENKVEGILKQLKFGVESIQQSDQFRLFLSTMGKFHDYSIGNMILIMLQKPQATHVAGFNTWKELGRWVKSGEKGIAILAPVFPPAATCGKCGARIPRNAKFCPKCGEEVNLGEEMAATPRYFRAVYVFDLSQTEGKPLPEFEVPALTGEANEELFSQVLDLAREQVLTVSFESKPEQDPDIKGFYSGKLIWVRPEESRAQQLKTLLHEMAHYYTEGVMGISRKDAETIAESAAFAIGARFGFDSGVRSFPYVAIWSRDKKVLEENLAAIRKVTGKMIEGLARLSLKAGGAA